MEVATSFQRFQDEGYKNWIKTTMGLQCLKTRLGSFLENETDSYHRALSNGIKWNGLECKKKCDIKNLTPRSNQTPSIDCEVCVPWRNAIWDNHTNKSGQVYWNNSTPYLWPTEKWEVAKVYMPRGNKSHKSVGDFDISAFLNLMTFCRHFKRFVQNSLLTQVTNVRNQVMHSANFQVKLEDLQQHLNRIRSLGKALEKHVPEFQCLSKELDELQNLDFSLIFPDGQIRLQGPAPVKEPPTISAEVFFTTELQIMKEKMEYMAQLYDGDGENVLTPEELQSVRVFLEENGDLQKSLVPQWKRLMEVQQEHGQQIESLTGRVDELERKTHTPEPQFSTDTLMFKNHLFEVAIKRKWSPPVFSEIQELSGFRGLVKIEGQTFTGSQVCKSKAQSHQEVAKMALDKLDKPDDPVDEETHQSKDLSFFCSVSVVLDTKVSHDDSCSGSVEAVESAYRKLIPVFGLDLSASASSYKEKVLQFCQQLDVPPPEELKESGCFTLRLNGRITFHDLEGSTTKKQAQRQAAKAALKGLCGVLGNRDVFRENYVGTLKELLDASTLGEASYDFSETPGGEGVRWEPNLEKGGEVRDVNVDELSERDGADGPRQVPFIPTMPTEQPLTNEVSTSPQADTSITGQKQDTPTKPKERHPSGDLSFFCSVSVVLDTKVSHDDSCSGSVEAVESAYRKLIPVFGLDLSASASSYKEKVLQFCQQLDVPPPEESKESGCFTLRLNGRITFHDLEGSTTKKQAQQQAAKAALKGLCGVLGNRDVFRENYVGALKELLDVSTQGKASYDFSETPGGEGVRWEPNLEKGGEGRDVNVDELSERDGADGPRQVPVIPTMPTEQPLTNEVSTSPQADTSITGQKQDTPTKTKERHPSGDVGRFLGCVKVTIKRELTPCLASSQEGAVQAAYSSLMNALSLGPAGSVGERQTVLDFFTQTKCHPPVEEKGTTTGNHRCFLKVDGELTLYSPKRVPKKRDAEQLAAKEALRHLEGLLEGTSITLSGENYKGRLQELVAKQPGSVVPEYSTIDGQTPGGEGVRWEPNLEKGGEGRDVNVDELSERDGADGPRQVPFIPTMPTEQPLTNEVSTSPQADTSITGQKQDTPTKTKERHPSGDVGRFLGCVKVTIQKQLAPCFASSQEGAVQAAYSSLMNALSLGPAGSVGERQTVLDFFTQTKCHPPVEEKGTTTGNHRCFLKVDGELTLYSPKRMPKKKDAEQLAAKEALRHLEGLLEGTSITLSGENYKGRLQELVAKQPGSVVPEYSTIDGQTPATVTGQ